MKHGTSNMYTNGACRCDPCRIAHAKSRERHRMRTLNGERLHIPKTGAVRRIRALQAIGWRLEDIANEAGMDDRGSFGSLFSDRHHLIHVDTLARIDAAYQRLAGKPGPSQRTRAYAKAKGWPPPLAYDDIDDPDEVPDMTERYAPADPEEWLFLVQGGVDGHAAADRLGVTLGAIERSAMRKGLDHIARAARRAEGYKERSAA